MSRTITVDCRFCGSKVEELKLTERGWMCESCAESYGYPWYDDFSEETRMNDFKPIIVPAFTHDPNEECYCIECNTQMYRHENKFLCPYGCKYEVLILVSKEKNIRKDNTKEEKA